MRSGNEVSGLVIKAARGAGLPLGHAQVLGAAAPFLVRDGVLDLVIEALACGADAARLEGGCVTAASPVMALVAWQDLRAAGHEVALDSNVPDALRGAFEAASSGAAPTGPFEVESPLIDALAAYAARTFVPETDASRSGGAGAGLTDND